MPTSTSGATSLGYETFCSDLSFDELLSFLFSSEATTYGEASEALKEVITNWEAVTPPEEAAAWYDTVLIAMQSFKTVLDTQSKNNAIDGETVGEAVSAFYEGIFAAPGLLSKDLHNSLVAAGCLGANAKPDNHGNDQTTATAIATRDAIEGGLNYLGDIDYFQFQAEAGTVYQIVLPWLSILEIGTKSAPLIAVYDAVGQEVVSGENDIEWEAKATEVYYVALGDGANLGSYTFTVITEDLADDFDNATVVVLGVAVQGSLDSRVDRDVFAVPVEAGRSYEVVLTDYTFGRSGDSQPGPIITVYDSDGQEIAKDDMVGSPSVVWQAGATGNNYVVLGDGASSGDYTLTVTQHTSTDDHGDDIDSATAISVGGSVEGNDTGVHDTDFFVFQAEAGKSYAIDILPGTLENTILSLYDSNGNLLSDTFLELRLVWRAAVSGAHFVKVDGHLTSGSYTLSVTVVEDAGEDMHSARSIALGEPAEDAIDHLSDIDFFVFQAEADVVYQVDVALGTLVEDWDLALFDPDGNFVSDAYESGFGLEKHKIGTSLCESLRDMAVPAATRWP